MTILQFLIRRGIPWSLKASLAILILLNFNAFAGSVNPEAHRVVSGAISPALNSAGLGSVARTISEASAPVPWPEGVNPFHHLAEKR